MKTFELCYRIPESRGESRWVATKTFADVNPDYLPGAAQPLVIIDSALPQVGVGAVIQAVAARSAAPSRVTVDVSDKTELLFRTLADEISKRRADMVYIVGGGTLSDVAGFAASVVSRGVPIVLFPTTTLAMCDASVGGKTGLDRHGVKNAWGTIHLPLLTIACVEWLETLCDRHFRAGFAEVAKFLFLERSDALRWLRPRVAEILGRRPDVVLETLWRGVNGKAGLIGSPASRRFSLFGHNVGHAIEILSGLPHGEAVSIGMAIETELAIHVDYAPAESLRGLTDILTALSLPNELPVATATHDLCNVMRHQRLFNGGMFEFWLPAGLAPEAAVCRQLRMTSTDFERFLERRWRRGTLFPTPSRSRDLAG